MSSINENEWLEKDSAHRKFIGVKLGRMAF